jgi:Mn2+/Fe2+ NRAMP family transporter
VTIVAAGLAGNLVPDLLPVSGWAAAVLISIIAILAVGRYALLDTVLKGMMVVFALITVMALFMALSSDAANFSHDISTISFTSAASIAFMVALVGWMPTSVEVSVWHSLWTLSRMKQTNHKMTVKDALFDFNFGFVFCMVLALVFLLLGATLIYGTGEVLSGGAVGFTGQLVDLFVKALGDWTWPLIALITFIAMYSTCLAVSAGFSGVWSRVVKIIYPAKEQLADKVYLITLVSISIGGWLIINSFGSSLRQLIDFATTVSFVSAPVFAFLNLRLMSLSHVPEDAKLGRSMNSYSWICFYILTGFSGYFVYWRFF